ncbi:MAG: glutaredoxin family protein [Actinomycetota bacterium]
MLYSRRNCHLCEEAREHLKAAGYEFRELDVDGDPALRSEFGTLVPVVEVDGEMIFTAGMPASQLPQLLAERKGR